MELMMMSVLKIWSKNSDQGLRRVDMILQKHQLHQPIMATCTNFKHCKLKKNYAEIRAPIPATISSEKKNPLCQHIRSDVEYMTGLNIFSKIFLFTMLESCFISLSEK